MDREGYNWLPSLLISLRSTGWLDTGIKRNNIWINMSVIVYFNKEILTNLKWFISANFLVPKKAFFFCILEWLKLESVQANLYLKTLHSHD